MRVRRAQLALARESRGAAAWKQLPKDILNTYQMGGFPSRSGDKRAAAPASAAAAPPPLSARDATILQVKRARDGFLKGEKTVVHCIKVRAGYSACGATPGNPS